MAALGIKGAAGAGVSSGTSNTAWVDVCTIAAGDLTGGEEYVYIAGGDADLNGGADECRFRVIRGSTVLSHATIAIEEVNTADRPMWGDLLRDTQPGTAEAVKIQCQPSGTAAHTADAWLVAIPVGGLTENTDFHWAEVTADQTIPTAWDTSGAAVTFTPNGTDTYLVMACSINDPTIATQSSEFGIRLDSGTPDAILILEGEDATNERRGDFAMWTYTPSNASHTFRAVYQATAGAQTNAILRSAIFALRLNIFDQFVVDQNAAEITLGTGGTFTNIAGVDPTPDVTGPWVLLGSARGDVGSLGEGMKTRMQVNPSGGGLVSRPNYGDDGPGTFGPDARDEQPVFLSAVETLSSGAAREVNLDATASVGAIPAEDRCLVVFSVELAAAGGTTHDKAGALVVSAQGAAADVGTFAELGALVSATRSAAADVFQAAEAGSLVASAVIAGVAVEEAGGKAGSLLASALASAADVVEFVEQGALAAGGRVSAADVLEAAELGSLVARAALAGSDAATINRGGVLLASALLAAADAATFAEAAALAPGARLAGVAAREGAGKAGVLLSSARAAGTSAEERTRAAALIASAQQRGADVFEAREAAALIAGALAAGLDVFIAAESGSLLSATLLGGVNDSAAPVTFHFLRPSPSAQAFGAGVAAATFGAPSPGQVSDA